MTGAIGVSRHRSRFSQRRGGSVLASYNNISRLATRSSTTLSPPHLAEASPQSTFFKTRIADAYPSSHITPQVQCPLLVPLTASTNKVPLEERLSSQPNSTAQKTSRWTGPRRRPTPSSPPRFSLHLHALARHARLASPSIDLMGGA